MNSPVSKLQRLSKVGAVALLSGCIMLGAGNTAFAISDPATTDRAASFSPLRRTADDNKPKTRPKQQSKPTIQAIGFGVAMLILVAGERDRLFGRRQPAKNTRG